MPAGTEGEPIGKAQGIRYNPKPSHIAAALLLFVDIWRPDLFF